jgi:iron complex transport system ATP-binding protein
MALAQETEVLLLDEPTTFLDLAHQVEVLDLIAELNATRARTVVMVLHDLNHAARYAAHVLAMKGGAIVAAGPPDEVVTQEAVQNVFGLDCLVVPCPVSGRPLVVPKGRHDPRR